MLFIVFFYSTEDIGRNLPNFVQGDKEFVISCFTISLGTLPRNAARANVNSNCRYIYFKCDPAKPAGKLYRCAAGLSCEHSGQSSQSRGWPFARSRVLGPPGVCHGTGRSYLCGAGCVSGGRAAFHGAFLHRGGSAWTAVGFTRVSGSVQDII